tara:strand:- start:4532 stop:4924 length:393 start_codon:yes stop_codon:yes gene_type:complete
MNITTAFPSKYLRAADLQGKREPVVMDRVLVETVGSGTDVEDRPVLYFAQKDKGIVLNKTNANTISDAYGAETDTWEGKTVVLFPSRVAFSGKMVDCIRIDIPAAPPAETPAPDPEPEQHEAVSSDDIPF